MNDLMTHVERIVRPVRASQRRKLHMRRELLTHLESAVLEERARGADAPTAIDRATLRLGPPADLTRSLQNSVPRIERLLLSRIPAPHSLDRWETRAARAVWRTDRPTTMLHAFVHLATTFVFSYAALLTVATTFRPIAYLTAAHDNPAGYALFNVFNIVVALTLFLAAGRYTSAVADLPPSTEPRPRRADLYRAAAYAALLLAAPVVTMLACAPMAAGRPATPAEISRAALTAVALLTALTAVGRLLAVLRRPYEPWLSLDVST
jgi:hypothetical protein